MKQWHRIQACYLSAGLAGTVQLFDMLWLLLLRHPAGLCETAINGLSSQSLVGFGFVETSHKSTWKV